MITYKKRGEAGKKGKQGKGDQPQAATKKGAAEQPRPHQEIPRPTKPKSKQHCPADLAVAPILWGRIFFPRLHFAKEYPCFLAISRLESPPGGAYICRL